MRVTICGAMVALSIIFCRLLGFPQTGAWRVDFGFLPIAVVGLLFGPIWSGVSYGLADLVGALIFTGVNPLITLQKVFVGVVMGLFFHHRTRIGTPRILISLALIAIFLDFAAMVPIFHYYFGKLWGDALLSRALSAGVNFPLRVIVLLVCDRHLVPLLTNKASRLFHTQQAPSETEPQTETET